MRDIPNSFEPSVVLEIDKELTSVAAEHGVAIPIAVESGSRAWGFPSPDSDDCRFVFVRPLEHYLSPWPPRDVIESEPRGLLDVNGWDLKKAVQLLVKGNAVILEWMQSPIVYRADPRSSQTSSPWLSELHTAVLSRLTTCTSPKHSGSASSPTRPTQPPHP